jgi:hypothetical protein
MMEAQSIDQMNGSMNNADESCIFILHPKIYIKIVSQIYTNYDGHQWRRNRLSRL